MKKNNKLILYHGSNQIISDPEYGKGRYANDYGQGFYCTEHKELAGEWACGSNTDGYINKYSLDFGNLNYLDIKTTEYPVLNWLALLLRFRMVAIDTPVMKAAKEYICEKYFVDISGYDILRGYRADDSYFSFARAFISNSISLEQLSVVMQLGDLGEQVVLKSPEAFEHLRYLGYEAVLSSEYYTRKKYRDIAARKKYLKILEDYDKDGIYVSQLISGKVGENDERLR